MKDKVYLDHHTSSFPEPSALACVQAVLAQRWASTSSPYSFGQEAINEIEQAYEAIKEMLGMDAEDSLYFVSNGAEATHEVLYSFYTTHIRNTGKNHILTTSTEEAPLLLCLKQLENLGCSTKILEVNTKGLLDANLLKDSIKPRSSLLTFSWANGLTGVIHPLEEIVHHCKAKDLHIHVDASHIIGKIYFRFKDYPIDFMTIDGRSVNAPLGTSLIMVKKGVEFSPTIVGKGSFDVAGILSFKMAIEKAQEHFDHMSLECARLVAKLKEGIEEGYKEAIALFQNVDKLPNTVTIAFPGVSNEALLFLLDKEKIFASIGGGKHQKISGLLQSCKQDSLYVHSAISFALSYKTSEQEIERAIIAVVQAAKKLRALSLEIVKGDL